MAMKKLFVVLAAIFLLAVIACSGGGDSGGSSSTHFTDAQIKEFDNSSKSISSNLTNAAEPDSEKALEDAKTYALTLPNVESAKLIEGNLVVKYKGGGSEIWIKDTPSTKKSSDISELYELASKSALREENAYKASVGNFKAILINTLYEDPGSSDDIETFNSIHSVLEGIHYDAKYLNGPNANLENLANLSEYSVIVFGAHGGFPLNSDNKEVYAITTGQEWDDSNTNGCWMDKTCARANVKWGSLLQRMWRQKSLVAVTGEFWKEAYKNNKFNRALFFNSACDGAKNKIETESFINNLKDMGIVAYTGWTDTTSIGNEATLGILTKMVEGKSLQEAFDSLPVSSKSECISTTGCKSVSYLKIDLETSITLGTEAAATAKAIKAFSLNGVSGTINETAKTIAVTMPHGTDVTALVATFTTTGTSVKVGSNVQISGTTANNFTSPVTYTVTAADATTQNYTVTVPVAASGTYSMSGTIHIGSNSGTVLSGATVSIAGKTYTTVSNGTFTFSNIPGGTYVFTVSKSGYDTFTNSAYYIGSDKTGLNFYLTQTVTPPSGIFPIGTWDGGQWGSFTVTKLIQTIGTTKYYSGSVSYSTFGSVSVSGEQMPSSGNLITFDGDTFVVQAFGGVGTINPTVYAFWTTVDQLHGGNAVGAYLWGNLVISTNIVGASYSDSWVFTKTK